MTIITIFMLLNDAMACSIPAQGTHWTHNELIDNTATILLVTPEIKHQPNSFKIIEVIKGVSSDTLNWIRFRPKDSHKSEDFNGHKDRGFWQEAGEISSRVNYLPGACTLQFTFVEDEEYLIFKESVGHPHSAEIIKSKNDSWYHYVLERVNGTVIKQ